MSSATSAKGQSQVTDSMLISRIRAGDEDALALLHDRYAQVVYSVALRVLAETTQAEDILQELFLQLWRNPQAFDSNRGSLGAWLAVIARHRAIDYL
ncbi:MAG TPA: sigma factor, partial [Terriglobales bacterium]|nr:sigma factor [Terriglobales bacterium]